MPIPRSLLVPLCLLPLGIACGSHSNSGDAGEPSWWLEAQKPASAQQIYFMTAAVPAVAMVILSSEKSPFMCAEPAGDHWYIEIELATPADGTTVSVGGAEDAVTTGNASVAVYHEEPSQAAGWKAHAVSGQLVVSSFPAAPDALGVPFAGHLTALFPDDPISTIDCQGGGESLPDGGFAAAPGACACQTADGGTFSCDLPASAGPLTSCCYGDAGTTARNYQLSFDFSATRCGAI